METNLAVSHSSMIHVPHRQHDFKTATEFSLGGLMLSYVVVLIAVLAVGTSAYADGGHSHQHVVPTLKNQATTTVTATEDTVTLTFGPLDLPTSHDGDMGDSMPRHHFQLPQDRYLVGFKSAITTKDGKELPKNFLHHILMINNSKPSVSCPGEPLFFGGPRGWR
jgi:hypothetical protein